MKAKAIFISNIFLKSEIREMENERIEKVVSDRHFDRNRTLRDVIPRQERSGKSDGYPTGR